MVFLDCPGVSYVVLGCPMVSCGNQMHPANWTIILQFKHFHGNFGASLEYDFRICPPIPTLPTQTPNLLDL